MTLAPWGSPPTPLLPRWFRENCSKLRLPKALRKLKPSFERVADLDVFWEEVQSPLDKKIVSSLASLVSGYRPPPDHVVIPAGIDHREIAGYPLRRRTRNVLQDLHRKGLLRGEQAITVGLLMSKWSFGITSLLDLMCVAEVALALRERESGVQESDKRAEAPGYPTTRWTEVVHQLDVLLAAANEFYGAHTVGEALELDLHDLATMMGIVPKLNSYAIGDLTKRRSIGHTTIARLADLRRSIQPRELLILEQRLCSNSPARLDDLGKSIGVSRERVRQIEQGLQARIEERVGAQIDILASFVGKQMQPVMDVRDFDNLIAGLFAESDEELSTTLAIRMVREQLDYTCENGVCLSEAGTRIVSAIEEMAYMNGDEVGLVTEEALKDHLPDEDWCSHFAQIIQACGFFQFGKWVAPKATVAARVKAALLSLGQPATVEEIAEASGLEVSKVGGKLRKMVSVSRADKARWGLSAWIEDEYEGIASEIVQRIHEDGGATTLERLLEELPRLFKVSKSSVRTIVGAPQFALSDGYVSLADPSSISLRDLNDVIHGRTEVGEAYWTFLVEERYFDGYSLARLPPELARELGCEPNENKRVALKGVAGGCELSVSWALSSPNGATLGRLAQPLKQLGVKKGDRVRLVIKGAGALELQPETTKGKTVRRSAESALDRIKGRRSVIGHAS